jgi:ankyrin repeat protein
MSYDTYSTLMNLIAGSDLNALERAAASMQGFPDGTDDFTNRRWITNAIDCGSLASIQWMLSKGVQVRFKDDEGYTPLHSAIDRDHPDKHEVIKLLINSGADINAHGINDWTPSHMAAVRNDLISLKIILEAGPDLAIRTRIDNFSTAMETAIRHKASPEIIALLNAYQRS